jgi:hypothetical protein
VIKCQKKIIGNKITLVNRWAAPSAAWSARIGRCWINVKSPLFGIKFTGLILGLMLYYRYRCFGPDYFPAIGSMINSQTSRLHPVAPGCGRSNDAMIMVSPGAEKLDIEAEVEHSDLSSQRGRGGFIRDGKRHCRQRQRAGKPAGGD